MCFMAYHYDTPHSSVSEVSLCRKLWRKVKAVKSISACGSLWSKQMTLGTQFVAISSQKKVLFFSSPNGILCLCTFPAFKRADFPKAYRERLPGSIWEHRSCSRWFMLQKCTIPISLNHSDWHSWVLVQSKFWIQTAVSREKLVERSLLPSFLSAIFLWCSPSYQGILVNNVRSGMKGYFGKAEIPH